MNPATTVDAWRGAIRWLLVIQALSMGAMEMTGPFWPLFLRELSPVPHVPFAWVASAAYFAPMAATLVTAPWWGRLADRVGPKPMILRALVALAASQLWSVYADSAASVLLARTVQGGLAGFLAAAQIYAMRVAPADMRRRVFADLQTVTACGSFMAPPVGAWLVGLMGFRMANTAGAVVILACIPLAMFCLPAIKPAPRSETERDTDARQARRAPLGGLVIGLLLGMVAVQAARVMPQSFLAPYITETLHGSVMLAGLAYSATAATLALSARWWAQRFAGLPVHVTLGRVCALTAVCAGISLWQGLAQGEADFIVARLAWGLCLGGLLPVLNSLVVETSPEDRQGFALGLCSSAAKGGALIGLGVAALSTGLFGWRAGFVAMTGMYLAALAALLAVRRAGASHTASAELSA
ncbi:Staphyloferrin B transporter [Ralstonia condita]|uniref:Staphyloferrin B transporter n=1 Tax=Ralstonia condita TaxID=3058600 RepID=A0ABN9IXI6_9RALS|nr:rhizoferrin export MFS transporter [Ralstonia sp. LMG 7141]CAJ0795812.1 Staphyloferrin B transporter [Ralstonia sp. LMG 7141]